jgi:hypothetical protein
MATGGKSSSSTESDLDRQAEQIFNDCLVPLAERLRRRTAERLPLGVAADLASYYVAPARPAMRAADFECDATDSPEAFLAALSELWAAQGCQDLTRLCEALRQIAAALRQEPPVEGEEISPFIYAMY